MALPTWGNQSGKAAAAGAISPANPAGLAVGDLDIMVAVVSANATGSITANGGTAWTAIPGVTFPVNGSGTQALYAWYRISQSGDTAPTVTPSANVAVGARFRINAGTFDAASPFEAAMSHVETTSDTSLSVVTGVSTAGADRLVCLVATVTADSNTGQIGTATDASLANILERFDYCTNLGTASTSVGIAVDTGELAVAGSTGTWASTYNTSSTKSAISFAIRPFVPGALPPRYGARYEHLVVR